MDLSTKQNHGILIFVRDFNAQIGADDGSQ